MTLTAGIYLKIRRQARQRREYIYRKSIEERERTIEEKKDKVRKALEREDISYFPTEAILNLSKHSENRPIPTDLRTEAVDLQKKLKWDDEGGEGE